MKTLITLLLISPIGFAGSDLIFKDGFEQLVTIGGTVAGLSGAGLSLTLTNGSNAENLPINNDGGFVFASQLTVGESWSVVITTLPVSHNCTISNASGSTSSSGVNDILVECSSTISGNWNEMNWNTGIWQ